MYFLRIDRHSEGTCGGSRMYQFRRREQHKGFTLLELLLVIAILGLFSSMAVPAFSDFIRDYRLRSFSNKVLVMMRSVRFKALTENRVIRIKTKLGSSTNYGNDEINFEICTEKAEYGNNCPGTFVTAPGLSPMKPPNPVIIYEVCNSNSSPYGTSTGTHYMKFDPDGKVTGSTNDKPSGDVCGGLVNPYIQLTYSPVPNTNEHCKFRTVMSSITNGLPQLFKFRRQPYQSINDPPLSNLSCR